MWFPNFTGTERNWRFIVIFFARDVVYRVMEERRNPREDARIATRRKGGTDQGTHWNTRRNAWQNGQAMQGNAREMRWERTGKVRENAQRSPRGTDTLTYRELGGTHARLCRLLGVNPALRFSQGWASAQGLFESWEYGGTRERQGNARRMYEGTEIARVNTTE